jgi:hypothetical protein
VSLDESVYLPVGSCSAQNSEYGEQQYMSLPVSTALLAPVILYLE